MKTLREKPILVAVPNSLPIKRNHQNTISVHNTNNYYRYLVPGTRVSIFVFLRCPVQICECRPENVTSYFLDVPSETESEPFFFSLFKQVTAAFAFFRIIRIGLVSFNKKKECKGLLLFVCGFGCVTITVPKNRVQIRSIERGVRGQSTDLAAPQLAQLVDHDF